MAGRFLSPAFLAPTSLRYPPNSACAPVCTMQSLLSATDSELSDILASISNEDEEEADCDFHSAGQGFDSDLANRGMRQIRLLLARTLRVRVRDHLLSEFLRSALADSLGLTESGGTVLPAQAGAAPADRSTERDTITAMDAQTPPHCQQLAASSRCRALLAERLRRVFFPDRCARLLIDSLLAKQLRLCGEALTCPMLTGAADRDTTADTRRSASSTSTRKPSPPRRQRRRRRSSRQRRQQRRLTRRQSRSCSASTPSTLKSVEFALQVDQPELQPAAAAAVVPALNTDGSNSYRQQPQAKQTSSFSTGIAHFDAEHSLARGLEDNQHHQQRHRNRHRERNHQHRQHHQHHHHHQHQHHQHQHYQPPPAVTQTSLCQRLCLLHSTPGGFKASLKPSPTASSTCAVCASRHFLLRQLGRMVASRATGQLAELERTLGDCLEQQRRWQRSLQWIASNVKEHRLPGSVRPFVNSCGCSADRSF